MLFDLFFSIVQTELLQSRYLLTKGLKIGGNMFAGQKRRLRRRWDRGTGSQEIEEEAVKVFESNIVVKGFQRP